MVERKMQGDNDEFCFVSNLDGDETRISVLVTEMGGAAEGVDRDVEALLRRSGEIADLKVEQ